jgi:putative ABC transport system permease protein
MSYRRRSLMPGAGRRLAQVATLAAKGLWFHRRLTLYQMIGLAAVLLPLLLIAGLKNGFIEGMLAHLRADPRNLEVIVVGNRNLDSAWFRTVAGSPAAGFVIPTTRSLSATITLANDQGGTIGDVQMIPTAPGDPLLGGLPVPAADDEVVLSAATARKLGVAAGDRVRAAVQRRMNGQDQASVRSLRVRALAPETLAPGDFAFVTLPLLVLSGTTATAAPRASMRPDRTRPRCDSDPMPRPGSMPAISIRSRPWPVRSRRPVSRSACAASRSRLCARWTMA